MVEGTGTVLHTDSLEGKSGEPIEYSTVAKLAELKALGYDLVSDGFTTATDKNYDKDTKVDLSFVVTVTPHIEPIKPFDPTNPNDPNTPKPGQPIDPNNPDGPKWTKELIEKLETTKHVTRTITYVEDGTNKEVANRVTEKVTFTREAEINLVTGDIEYSQWRSNFDIFGSFKSPDVKGYVLKDSAQRVVEGKGVTETTPDETIKVVYVPVGKVTITVPLKPQDPTDLNSPKVPVIPHIPGTTPQVPKDSTKLIGPNNPLRPVTPSTPEPGKPVFPEDPNSPVCPESVKELVTESSATCNITYVDRDGKEVAATHTETIKFKRTAKVNLVTGEITYGEWTVVGDDTILNGNKLPKVDGYIARGGDIKESQEDVKAEVGKNITQTVVYAKLGSWIPRLPEGQTKVPPTQYPNDPTDPTKPGTDKTKVPYVPGFIPVDPTVYGWST